MRYVGCCPAKQDCHHRGMRVNWHRREQTAEPVAVLAARGASGLDVYGWLGALATYGFIVAYALVCVALPRYLRHHEAFKSGAQIIPWLAAAAMLLALVGNLYPMPEGPYGKLPYIFLAYLIAGLGWFLIRARAKRIALAATIAAPEP